MPSNGAAHPSSSISQTQPSTTPQNSKVHRNQYSLQPTQTPAPSQPTQQLQCTTPAATIINIPPTLILFFIQHAHMQPIPLWHAFNTWQTKNQALIPNQYEYIDAFRWVATIQQTMPWQPPANLPYTCKSPHVTQFSQSGHKHELSKPCQNSHLPLNDHHHRTISHQHWALSNSYWTS